MSVRVIFAPLTGRKSDKSVLATAAGTAKRFNAHIDIVSVRADPRDAIPYLGEGLLRRLGRKSLSTGRKRKPATGPARRESTSMPGATRPVWSTRICGRTS